MVVKLTNIDKKFKIIKTKFEYFNTLFTHFLGSKNSFSLVFVFVLIWRFSSISSLFTSI